MFLMWNQEVLAVLECLPEASPSQPTVTATCRPRTWMQQITEGQINEPRREDASSSESNTSAIETLPDKIS